MNNTQNALISIYDAALSDRNWNKALDTCRDHMGAAIATIYEFSTAEQTAYSLDRSCSNVRAMTSMMEEYNSMLKENRGSGYDQEGVLAIHRAGYCSVVLDEDIWDIQSDYFDRPEIIIPLKEGLLRRSFINLSEDPATMKGIVFLYDRAFDDGLPANNLANGPIIAPHAAKAAEIFRFTDGLRQKYNAVLSVLDQITTGILVVSENADVIVSNKIAKQILEDGNGLRSTPTGGLFSGDENARATLLHAISEVSATARGENSQTGAIIQLPRRGDIPPLVAIVSPLRDAEFEIERGLTGALVTLIDPERPVQVQSGVISAAYGLTQAEARVAEQMLQGLTNVEIAEQLDVSPETIKTQISSVLSKSGCKSRIAFIWRVFQLSPPIK